METQNKAPLRLNVLEFGHAMAGPLISGYMAYLGAKVIKVESRKSPDLTRFTATLYKDGIPGLNRGTSFQVANASKYGFSLNLKHPRAPEIMRLLVAWADVLVENHAPGWIAKQGYGYQELSQIHPDIIVVSASLQGQDGPHARQPGFGYMLNALSGQVELTGWPDRPGVMLPIPWSDFITPWFGVLAVMSALDYRRRTGKGMYIDLSEYESSLAFLPVTILDYTVNGRQLTRQGNASHRGAPHGVYRCKGDDRWCAIAISSDEEWLRFCQATGHLEWGKDPRFHSPSSRVEHNVELDRLVETWTINYEAEEIMQRLQSIEVAAGIVQNSQDILERDLQVKERQFFQRLANSEIGPALHRGSPIRFSSIPTVLKPAPCLGEHTEYICTQILGMLPEEYQKLKEEGLFE